MTAAEEDIEHWPDDNKDWTQPAAAVEGYDSSPGFQHMSWLPSNAKSPLPAQAFPAPPDQVTYPPIYYAHPQQHMMAHAYQQQPQYYAHPPQQVMYASYPPPHGYYTYAAPQPQPQVLTAPAPAVLAEPTSGANFHIYQPTYSDPKSAPAPQVAPAERQGNVWLGRTKGEVDEDNMKIAKREGAYGKRKIAPVDVKDDQIFWVVELDGSHSLRDFRYIKELKGTWKKDPRFEDSYYFVCEESKKK